MMIKVVVAVVLLTVAYVTADCVGLTPSPPTPQNLSFCAEYKDSACCKPSTDAALAYQWTNQIVPIYGSDGCGENIKALLCGFSCSPDQTSFATIGFVGGFPALSVFVNATVSAELFDSCKDRCLPFNPPATVGNYYVNSAGLLAGFNTSNDPSYNVSLTNPDISFHEGVSSAGGALTVAQVDGSGNDLTGCNGTDYQCLDPTNPYAAARSLTFCTEYSSASCCTLDQENDLITNFNTKVTPLFGEDNCAENIKALFCAWVCSPKQREISVIAPSGGYNTETVYVSQAFANGTYNSCKDRCFVVPGQPSLTIEQIYGSASYPALAFITQFNSSNDASYKPDNYTRPAIVYQVGATNPLNGGDFDGTTLAGSGSDVTGCSTGSSTTSASDAVALIASLVPVVAAFFVALF